MIGVTYEKELKAAVERFRTAPERALQERDERIRAIAEKYNLRQIDIIKVTGYSRETVRQALHPEARAAVKAALKARKDKPTDE